MHVVFDKITINTAPRLHENNTAMAHCSIIELRDKQVDLAFIADNNAKILHIFAYNGLPRWGATAP